MYDAYIYIYAYVYTQYHTPYAMYHILYTKHYIVYILYCMERQRAGLTFPEKGFATASQDTLALRLQVYASGPKLLERGFVTGDFIGY